MEVDTMIRQVNDFLKISSSQMTMGATHCVCYHKGKQVVATEVSEETKVDVTISHSDDSRLNTWVKELNKKNLAFVMRYTNTKPKVFRFQLQS